ncbi:MAG: hypothetical protein ACOYL3_07095 [Desulfuromonadaceae bacterium]
MSEFLFPPILGWCTKHSSTTVCKDCQIEQLSEANKRYREALEKIVSVADNDVVLCEPNVFDIAREALEQKE